MVEGARREGRGGNAGFGRVRSVASPTEHSLWAGPWRTACSVFAFRLKAVVIDAPGRLLWVQALAGRGSA